MGGTITPKAGKAMVERGTITNGLIISYLMATEMGPEALSALKDQMRQTVEFETGRPHVWRTLINIDAIELVPEGCNE